MPNWCQNYIRITGPKKKIEALWETAEKTDGEFGLFSAMRPEPNYDEVTVYKTYVFDEQEAKERPLSETPWYDWRLQNWSCKWNPSDHHGLEYQENGDEAEITGWFDTAWAPAIKVYAFFIENNHDCSIHAKYYEGGNDFMGTWEDGEDNYIDSITNLINKGEKNWTYAERDLMEFFGILEEEWRFEEDDEEEND